MRTMGVKGLTLYHLKSHLQKYRLGKQACKEGTDNSKDGESQDTGSSTSSSKAKSQDLNDGYQITEALRVQMEVQRRLHEQLEVQRHLQLRIEAEGKYLQSILEKACKALSVSDEAAASASASAGLEAAREEFSELAIKVSGTTECDGIGFILPDTLRIASLAELGAPVQVQFLENNSITCVVPAAAAATGWGVGDCSVDSCLTSIGSPVSPLGTASQSHASVMKKRARPLLGNVDLLPLSGCCTQQETGWMMANI